VIAFYRKVKRWFPFPLTLIGVIIIVIAAYLK
jgi:hypothetical protein